MAKRGRASRWWTLGILIIAGCFVYLLRYVLLPFVIAGAFTFIIRPGVLWMHRRTRLPRVLLVFLLYLVVLGPAGLLAYLYWSDLTHSVMNFIQQVPGLVDRIARQLLGGDQVQVMGKTISADAVGQLVMTRLQSAFGTAAGVLSIASQAGKAVMGVILTLVLLFYLLVVREGGFTDFLLRLNAEETRPRVLYFIHRISHMIGRYLRGLVLIVLYASITSWIGLGLIFHLPYAVPIAVATGILELMPVIGPILSWSLAAFAAMIHGGFLVMVEVIVLYGLIRLSLDDFLGPVILGRAARIHPVFVIFAFLAGGTLLGIIGLLLAVPTAAVIRLILEEWAEAPAVGDSD